MIIFFIFMTGASFGSFLYCFAERYSLHESFMTGRSRCPVCGHVLGILDLIPVFSYILQKGRCRYCHQKIHIGYLLCEILCGSMFLLIFYVHGDLDINCFYVMSVACVLLCLSMTDFLTYEIPDRFHLMLILLWFIKNITIKKELPFLPFLFSRVICGFLISFFLLLLTFFLSKVRNKEMMGGGDIKLFFSVGLYLGFYNSVLCLSFSCVWGLCFMLILHRKAIPFGPCISLSFLLLLLSVQ